MNHLHAATELVVRNAMLEGLQFLRGQHPARSTFEYKEVVGQVARLLVPATAAATLNEWDQNKNVPWTRPNDVAEHPDNQKLFAALWSLIADGYLFPRSTDQARAGAYSVNVIRVTTTDRLERLAANADAHPAHPGFIKRFRGGTPTATDEVVAYLEDAVSCAEAHLCRPALAMVGVANEQTIRTAFNALDHLGAIPAGAGGGGAARNLLAATHASIPTWQTPGAGVPQTKEERHRLNLAVTFSEALRVERNKVAHPGASLADEVMVEQMIAGFAHHAGAYWEIIIKHAVTQGFAP